MKENRKKRKKIKGTRKEIIKIVVLAVAVIFFLVIDIFFATGKLEENTPTASKNWGEVPNYPSYFDTISTSFVSQNDTESENVSVQESGLEMYDLSISQDGVPTGVGTMEKTQDCMYLEYVKGGELDPSLENGTYCEEIYDYSEMVPGILILDTMELSEVNAVAEFQEVGDTAFVNLVGFTQDAGYGVYFSDSQQEAWKMTLSHDGTCTVEEASFGSTKYYWGYDGNFHYIDENGVWVVREADTSEEGWVYLK